jgi:hypothetical protein
MERKIFVGIRNLSFSNSHKNPQLHNIRLRCYVGPIWQLGIVSVSVGAIVLEIMPEEGEAFYLYPGGHRDGVRPVRCSDSEGKNLDDRCGSCQRFWAYRYSTTSVKVLDNSEGIRQSAIGTKSVAPLRALRPRHCLCTDRTGYPTCYTINA